MIDRIPAGLSVSNVLVRHTEAGLHMSIMPRTYFLHINLNIHSTKLQFAVDFLLSESLWGGVGR